MGWKDTIKDEKSKSWRDTIEDDKVQSEDKSSLLGTIARQAGQGLMFGGLDEVAAEMGTIFTEPFESKLSKEDVLKHISPALRAKIKPEDVEPVQVPKRDTYEDLLKAARKQLKQDVETRPVTSLASNIGGALVSPAGKLGTAAKGAGALARTAKAATGGAAVGGATGFLSGEGGIEQRLEGAQTGATVGGLFGGLAQGSGEAISGAARKIGGTDLGKLFSAAKGGKALSETIDENITKLRDLGSESTKGVLRKVGKERAGLGKALSQAAEQGKTIDMKKMVDGIRQELADLPESVNTRKISKILDAVDIDNNPETAFKLFKDIKRLSKPSGKDAGERAVFKAIDTRMKESLSEAVDVSTPYNKMSELLSQYKLLTGKDPSKFSDAFNKLRMRDKTAKLLSESDPGVQGKTTLKEILGGFDDVKGLEEVAPDIAQKIQSEAPELAEKIRLGMKASEAKTVSTITPNLRAQLLAQAGGGSGILPKVAEGAGKAIKGVNNIASSFDDTFLLGASKKLSRIGNQKYADIMQKLAVTPEQARKARLFSLMQTEGFRQAIKSVEDTED